LWPAAIQGYELLPSFDEDRLLEAVAHQPVAVGIAGQYSTFLFYGGGVYDDDGCGTQLNHALILVGFGRDHETGRSDTLIGLSEPNR
jgi:KDEL-tailed cysteine endopeptidase